jgi:precorrin-3B methylase
MLTIVLVGNSQTRLIPGREPRIYTPRGYVHERGETSTDDAKQ